MMNQKDISEEMRFLAQSEIRLEILNELNKRPNNVRGLVEKTHITYSSVSSNIKKLESRNHIKKIKNKYHMNPMTEICFRTLMEFKKSIELVEDYNSFWDRHNLNRLNLESIRNITDLKDSQLIETTPLDIYKTHNTTKKQLVESKNLKAIFPYLHPEYPQILEDLLRNDGNIEIILPKSIYKEMISPIDEKVRQTAKHEGKLKIQTVGQELNIYLTICDETMSLGLFKNDGSFDQNRILISNNEKSNQWAEDLFENIKGNVI